MWLGVLQWMEVEGGDTRRTSGEIFFEAQDWTSGVAWLRIHCASEVFFILVIWLFVVLRLRIERQTSIFIPGVIHFYGE